MISINGKPFNYIDRQDNVTLAPGETIKILIHPIDVTGKFVFHCHVLLQRSAGSWRRWVVNDPPPAEVNVDRVLDLVSPTGPAGLAQSHDSGAEAYLLDSDNLLAAVGE